MAYIVIRGQSGTQALSGSQYNPENKGTARLKIRTGNNKNDILEYGFTTDISASQYCPIEAKLKSNVKGYIGRNEEITTQTNTTTQSNYTTSTSRLVTNYTIPKDTYNTTSKSNYNTTTYSTVSETSSSSNRTTVPKVTTSTSSYYRTLTVSETTNTTYRFEAISGTYTTSNLQNVYNGVRTSTLTSVPPLGNSTFTMSLSYSTSVNVTRQVKHSSSVTYSFVSTYNQLYTTSSYNYSYTESTIEISSASTTYISMTKSQVNTISTRPSDPYSTYSTTTTSSSYYTGIGQYNTSSVANTTTITNTTTNNFNI